MHAYDALKQAYSTLECIRKIEVMQQKAQQYRTGISGLNISLVETQVRAGSGNRAEFSGHPEKEIDNSELFYVWQHNCPT